jgi:hypothetical protein
MRVVEKRIVDFWLKSSCWYPNSRMEFCIKGREIRPMAKISAR